MEQIRAITAYFAAEGRVIVQAPVAFFTCLVIAIFLAWFALNWRYSGQIENLHSTIVAKDATIASKDSLIADYKDKLGGATPDEARQRIDRLEKTLKPRRLSDYQRNIIDKEAVKAGIGSVTIEQYIKAPDGDNYQTDFLTAFKYIDWKIMSAGKSNFAPLAPTGLCFYVASIAHLNPQEVAVKRGLDAAGIAFDYHEATKPTGVGDVYLIITVADRS